MILKQLKIYKNCINKPIFLIYSIFFMYFMMEDSLGVVVPLFFEERKINLIIFGTLLSFTKIARAMIVIPISILNIKQKINCLKAIVLSNMIFLFLMVFINSTVLTFVTFSILFVTASVINVILNPLLGMKGDKYHIGIIFGIRDLFLYSGCFLGFLIIGIIKTISANSNLIWIFYISTFLIIYISVHSLEKEVNKFESNRSKPKTKDHIVLIKSRELIYYLVVLFVLGIGGACTSFVPIIALNIGVKSNSIFYIFSTSTFIAALLSITGGITIDKFNKKKLFQIDILLLLIVLVMYSIGNVWIFTIAIIISGISTALDNASNIYVLTNYSEDEINRFWGIIGSINLLSFSIGSFLCGVIYELNYHLLFLFGISINIIGLLMSFKLKNVENRG